MGAIPGGIGALTGKGGWVTRKQALVTVAVCLGLGAAGGWSLHRPRTVVSVREAEKTVDESAGLDLRQRKVEEHEPTVRTRERIVYRDGPVREKVVTRIEQGGSTITTDTKEQVHDDLHVAERITEKTTTVVGDGRWAFRALGSVDTRGTVAVGAGFDYRVVGPLVVGAWATAPVAGTPGAVTVGGSAGLRLP